MKDFSSTVLRTGPPGGPSVTLEGVRLSEFWARMDARLGAGYARSWAADHVLSGLDGRTVVEALDQGVDAKVVWRAVHDETAEQTGAPPSER